MDKRGVYIKLYLSYIKYFLMVDTGTAATRLDHNSVTTVQGGRLGTLLPYTPTSFQGRTWSLTTRDDRAH